VRLKTILCSVVVGFCAFDAVDNAVFRQKCWWQSSTGEMTVFDNIQMIRHVNGNVPVFLLQLKLLQEGTVRVLAF